MAIIRCEKGLHFYDNAKFGKCPHCGISVKSFRKEEDKNRDSVTVAKPASADVNIDDLFMKNIKPHIGFENDQEERTISFYSSLKGNDYVTGWLVCIEGPERGMDYRLHHGYNRIGRGSAMDVAIMEDMYISRDVHCQIVYEDKKNEFYLIPGNAALTYLNDENLNQPRKLETGDQIKIGNSSLEFIAFCRGDRKWSEE